MANNEPQPAKVETDLQMVAAISSGDDTAWAEFVEKFTDWVLYKSKEWCSSHCPYSAGSHSCSLYALAKMRSGQPLHAAQAECDDGMDTYVWIFEQLQKKVGKYSGRNNSLLSTFIWTILNSREFHIDWLRWKYGRAF